MSCEYISVPQLSAAYMIAPVEGRKTVRAKCSHASIWPWIMPASVASSAASRPSMSRTAGT